eukprot:403371720
MERSTKPLQQKCKIQSGRDSTLKSAGLSIMGGVSSQQKLPSSQTKQTKEKQKDIMLQNPKVKANQRLQETVNIYTQIVSKKIVKDINQLKYNTAAGIAKIMKTNIQSQQQEILQELQACEINPEESHQLISKLQKTQLYKSGATIPNQDIYGQMYKLKPGNAVSQLQSLIDEDSQSTKYSEEAKTNAQSQNMNKIEEEDDSDDFNVEATVVPEINKKSSMQAKKYVTIQRTAVTQVQPHNQQNLNQTKGNSFKYLECKSIVEVFNKNVQLDTYIIKTKTSQKIIDKFLASLFLRSYKNKTADIVKILETNQRINQLTDEDFNFETLKSLDLSDKDDLYKFIIASSKKYKDIMNFDELAKGGEAVVYRIQNYTGKELVAKCSIFKTEGDKFKQHETFQSILQETQTLKLLNNSEYIAQVEDEFILFDEQSKVIIQYVVIVEKAISSLHDILQIWNDEDQSIKLNECYCPEKFCYLILKSMEALEFLHQHDMFFGDMKPQNLLVFNDMNVKIGDLGVSIKLNPSIDENQKSYLLKGLSMAFCSSDTIVGFYSKKLFSKKELYQIDQYALILTIEKSIKRIVEIHNQKFPNSPKYHEEMLKDLQDMELIDVISKWRNKFKMDHQFLQNLTTQLKKEERYTTLRKICEYSYYKYWLYKNELKSSLLNLTIKEINPEYCDHKLTSDKASSDLERNIAIQNDISDHNDNIMLKRLMLDTYSYFQRFTKFEYEDNKFQIAPSESKYYLGFQNAEFFKYRFEDEQKNQEILSLIEEDLMNKRYSLQLDQIYAHSWYLNLHSYHSKVNQSLAQEAIQVIEKVYQVSGFFPEQAQQLYFITPLFEVMFEGYHEGGQKMKSHHITDILVQLIREPRVMPNFYHSHTNILILNRLADKIFELWNEEQEENKDEVIDKFLAAVKKVKSYENYECLKKEVNFAPPYNPAYIFHERYFQILKHYRQKSYLEAFQKAHLAVKELVLNNTFKDKYVVQIHVLGLKSLQKLDQNQVDPQHLEYYYKFCIYYDDLSGYQYLEYLKANNRFKEIQKAVQTIKFFDVGNLQRINYYLNKLILQKYFTQKESQDLDRSDALKIRLLLSQTSKDNSFGAQAKKLSERLFEEYGYQPIAAYLFLRVFHNLIQFDQSKHLKVTEIEDYLLEVDLNDRYSIYNSKSWKNLQLKFKEAEKDFMDRFKVPYVGGQKVYFQGKEEVKTGINAKKQPVKDRGKR